MGRIGRIFIAGVLALLPLLVTAVVTVWFVTFIQQYAGPGSHFGRFLISIGLSLSTSNAVAYGIGFLIVLVLVFILGLLVESSLQPWLEGGIEWLVRRIPLVSNVYDMSKRFVSIVDRKEGGDLKSMIPVWCFFGGEDSAAVLALMPSSEPVMIGETRYVAVLVPSAPVPLGGGLIFVPETWVRRAEGGVERLMSVYVSMGVTAPFGLPAASVTPAKLPAKVSAGQ